MANLYEIDKEILNCIDMETGEILDMDALKNLQMEREKKIEGVALWIKNLRSDIEAYKAEKESFEKKKKAAEEKEESLKNYLESYLAGEKFKTSRVTISYRKSESVIVENASLLGGDYLRYKEPEADKTKIKEAIKQGILIKGAKLEIRNGMQIR